MDAGTHDETAHAVRQQPDRLLRLQQQPIEQRSQAFAQHVERLPPVVGKALDTVAGGEKPAEIAIEHAEQFLRLDFRLSPGDLVEAATGNVEGIEPDPVAAPDLQVRPHDAGQDDDHRQIGDRRFATTPQPGAGHGCVGERPRQRLESRQRADIAAHQPVPQGCPRVDVAEIGEVRYRGATVEQGPRPRLWRDAGVHRIGIDDQIVVEVVEQQEVGQQHPQALQHAAALDVTGDHRHLDARTYRRLAQQARHR